LWGTYIQGRPFEKSPTLCPNAVVPRKTTPGEEPQMESRNTHLTPEQIEQFHRDGYLILPALFDAAEVAKMQQEADKLLELLINSSLALGRNSVRLDALKGKNGLPFIRKIQPINDLSEYLAEISHDARLLDPMRDLMQDEPILLEEKLNGKEPLTQPLPGFQLSDRVSDAFPVHNDYAYFKHNNYPTDVISSAISIDECTAENGPLHVWPGSHKEHLEHEAIPNVGLQVLPGLIDFDGGVDILAPAGSVMFFHSVLVHNSRANTTDQPRRIMIYSHYPKRFDMGDDIRNGPTRRQEKVFEDKYREMVGSGEFVDLFMAR